MLIALLGSDGVVAMVLHGAPLPLDLTLRFSLATAAGMVAGRLVSHRLSALHVQVGFAGALICVALGMTAKAALGG